LGQPCRRKVGQPNSKVTEDPENLAGEHDRVGRGLAIKTDRIDQIQVDVLKEIQQIPRLRPVAGAVSSSQDCALREELF